jgi:heavy metal translocating P-type ATPase
MTALLARTERLLLGAQLTLAMLSAGLLAVAVLWQFAVPGDTGVAGLVAALAAALVAVPVLADASRSLRHPSLHGVADRLVALALLAAWAAGDLMTAAVLPIVMILGHVLEERSLLGTREAVRALGRLAETRARRLLPGGGVELVAASALLPGDRIELRAGDRAPADGVVRAGSASLDMASLTGESVPVDVAAGDAVPAGSIDCNGWLEVEVTRTGADTTLGRIITLMRTAEESKPPVTRVLERYGEQYMALVLMAAAGTWFVSGDMASTLAVLVASCPCALVLAAPATAIAAIAVAARHGILIKGTGFLENLAGVDAVVFDKTGTLTTGVLSFVGCSGAADEAALLRVAAALGAASSHPVSRAAVLAGSSLAPVADAREEGGFGVTGTLDGLPAAFGREELFARLGVAVSPPPAHDGPIGGASLGGVFLGWLLFADRPRPEAAEALADLRGLGLERQVMLTGDRAAVAAHIGRELGIGEVYAEALPDDKMRRVQLETRAGFRPLVVGDGVNDSLALKAGAVGVAMGAQGTDVVLASADVVLTGSDLRRLGTAIRLSRRCRQTIQVNVGLGLGWTAVLVTLAALGVLGPQGPIIAALLHNLSTFLGLGNAGRLLLFDESGDAADSSWPGLSEPTMPTLPR